MQCSAVLQRAEVQPVPVPDDRVTAEDNTIWDHLSSHSLQPGKYLFC